MTKPTYQELIKILQQNVASVAEEIKSESNFTWRCTNTNPEKWQLGWFHQKDDKVYFPQAEITSTGGKWSVYAHIHGHPPYYGDEPDKESAIESAETYLNTNERTN